MWRVKLFEARPGSHAIDITRLMVSSPCTTRLNGQGTGSHAFRTYKSGLTPAILREVTRGNKYAIAMVWPDNTVGYAGIIGDDDWDENSSVQALSSKEFRAWFTPGRMTFGVNQYNPAGVTLTVTNRTHAAAARAVILAATQVSPEFGLSVDVPDDAVGTPTDTFSAVWRFEEKLTFENMLAQIEADGYEIMFRPYLTGGGQLRWATHVAKKITIGEPFDLAAKAPGSIVLDLKVKGSKARYVTGVLAFGKGQGQDAPYAYAPLVGSGAVDEPVRDVVVSFPDIEATPGAIAPGKPGYVPPKRLQDAANAEYAARNRRIEQWSFGLHIYKHGPAFALPAAQLRMWVYGSARIDDGAHLMRVIALGIDLSMKVTPEVQDG